MSNEDEQDIYNNGMPAEEPEEQSGIYTGEPLEDKSIIEKIIDTESLIDSFEKKMKGYISVGGEYVSTGKALATTKFINNVVNILRSFIAPQFSITEKDRDELDNEILDMTRHVIYACWDDQDITTEDMNTIVIIFYNTVNQYSGIIEGGKGRETIKQLMSGVIYDQDNKKEDDRYLLKLNAGNKSYKVGAYDK